MWLIIIGVLLNIGGVYLILDGAFSPYHGILVDIESGYNRLFLGVGIMVLGFILEIIGKIKRSKKF